MSVSNNASTPEAAEVASANALANAVALGCKVITKIAGDDIADGINGELLSGDELRSTLAAKINSYVAVQKG